MKMNQPLIGPAAVAKAIAERESLSELLAERQAEYRGIMSELSRAVLDQLMQWGSAKSLVIGPNDCSRIHALREKAASDGLIDQTDGQLTHGGDAGMLRPLKTFVVQQDWASLMRDEDIIGAEVKLPYPHCAFEFIVNSRPVIQMCLQPEGMAVQAMAFVNIEGEWVGCDPAWAKNSPILVGLWAQVVACCAFLEAEVVTHDVTRAPNKLNEKRQKQGKVPLMDFHTIKLNKRMHAAARSGAAGEPSHRVRLHFRRGHWRHFENHKTWIKWMLVGDPSLGFVGSKYQM